MSAACCQSASDLPSTSHDLRFVSTNIAVSEFSWGGGIARLAASVCSPDVDDDDEAACRQSSCSAAFQYMYVLGAGFALPAPMIVLTSGRCTYRIVPTLLALLLFLTPHSPMPMMIVVACCLLCTRHAGHGARSHVRNWSSHHFSTFFFLIND